jgi:hypothetical protein
VALFAAFVLGVRFGNLWPHQPMGVESGHRRFAFGRGCLHRHLGPVPSGTGLFDARRQPRAVTQPLQIPSVNQPSPNGIRLAEANRGHDGEFEDSLPSSLPNQPVVRRSADAIHATVQASRNERRSFRMASGHTRFGRGLRGLTLPRRLSRRERGTSVPRFPFVRPEAAARLIKLRMRHSTSANHPSRSSETEHRYALLSDMQLPLGFVPTQGAATEPHRYSGGFF